MIDLASVSPRTGQNSRGGGNPWATWAVDGGMKVLPFDKVFLASLRPRKREDRRKLFSVTHTRDVLEDVFGEELHLKRVRSLSNGVLGVLNAAVASVAGIGRAYAQVAGIETKSGIKQVDRLLSNEGVPLDDIMRLWVRHVVGSTERMLLAIDWTDFDDDDHTTLCAYIPTSHGRATPLAWKTVRKSSLAKNRNRHEREMIERLHRWLPDTVSVTLLGDRGFGYAELYRHLESLHWDYIIRFRQDVVVGEGADAAARGVAAGTLVPTRGRAQKLLNRWVTRAKVEVPAVVLVKRAGMKEAWCLATSLAGADAGDIVKAYSRRFTIEETFRDTKDMTFGLGLRSTHIRDTSRRDRMLFLVAVAHTLLTVLGAASEASGLDRTLKANTVKRRTMSLFNQGTYWYGALPNMREEWLIRLMTAYEEILRQHDAIAAILKFEPPVEHGK